MKNQIGFIAMALAVGLAADALAQFSPVKINVTKVQRRETKKEGRGDATFRSYDGGYSGEWVPGRMRTKSVPTEFGCKIEVVNRVAKPLKKVEVKWTVVIEEGKDAYVAESGTKNFDMEPAGKLEFETAFFPGKGAGYLVEVTAEGKPLVTVREPQNVTLMIERRGGGDKAK